MDDVECFLIGGFVCILAGAVMALGVVMLFQVTFMGMAGML